MKDAKLRSDAARNRARVLEVASEAFASEGLSVPVHEIARRAGVGTGTVSRHFPTKESLFAAVLVKRAQEFVKGAKAAAASMEPGLAFFSFFASLVREGVANRGLSDALAGTGFDLEAIGGDAGQNVFGELNRLLARAQRAGAIRRDVDAQDLKALLFASLSRARTTTDSRAQDRFVRVVCDGLRKTPAKSAKPVRLRSR